ncbi:RidA family protein [Streptomyces shenzhenensis]|uniref:RidA family protein n=1 Tax=Streptomyces shenzhenensis TaxID=943815 RepID=UPI003674229B
MVGTTVAQQTAQTLRNVIAVLKAGGAGLEDVVMLRVYAGESHRCRPPGRDERGVHSCRRGALRRPHHCLHAAVSDKGMH